MYKKKIDALEAEEQAKRQVQKGDANIGKTPTNLGTFENPIQVEPLDIAMSENKIYIEHQFRQNGVYYKQDLAIDCYNYGNFPTQGNAGAIFKGYEDYEIKTTLRRMQNKKTSIEDFRDLIQNNYKKIISKYDSDIERGRIPKYPKRPEIKDVEDEIYQNLINNALNNLELQKTELAKLKPITNESILWRGVRTDENVGYGGTMREIINDELKPGCTVVLDGATMCTSPNYYVARKFGPECIRIKAPAGSRLVRALEEVRFPAKAEFKFIGKTNVPGVIIWDFEYIVPV